MNEGRVSQLEDRLEQLEQRLLAVESRLSREAATPIEPRDLPPESSAVESHSSTSPGAIPPAEDSTGASLLSLLGRLLVLLGGAFLLRATTDAGAVPAVTGVTLGLLYGLAQVAWAARAARKGATRSANWLGVGGAIIVLPLLVESTLDFEILAPALAVFLLPAVGLLCLTVAVRSGLRAMAAVFLVGTEAVGLLLAARTGFGAGFPLGVILVGLVGLWLGQHRRWPVLAVVGAVVPLALVTALTLLVGLGSERPFVASLTPAVALSLQLVLVVGFLAIFLVRSLRASSSVGDSELMQASLATLVAIGGALVTIQKDPSLRPGLGVFLLVVGLGSYLTSFFHIDRREGSRRTFAFFATTALLATLLGSSLILGGWVRVGLFLVAALVLATVGARWGRATLSMHAALYVVGAGFASGLVGRSLDALVGGMASPPSADAALGMVAVLAVGLVCACLRVAHQGRTWGRLSRLPKAVYLLFLLVTIDGLVALYLGQRLARSSAAEIDVGILAAIRTGVLALSAVAIAYVARRPRLREGAHLVPVVLGLGALELVFGDLPLGRPATQFSSLALFGLALIFAPRMARRARSRGFEEA